MFCFNHTSAFYRSNNIVKMLKNNKFKAQTLTGNPTGNYRCQLLASHALNLSCSFSQSACSIKAGVWSPWMEGVFSCGQAALWMVQSVCPSVRLSVRLSVCHTFLTMFPSSYHHEIFRSYYQWPKWRPCKRSRSEVKGQGHRGHDPT